MVHVVAYFGFTATGSSDDSRERHTTTTISPTYVQQILQLQASGATEEELPPVVAQAVTKAGVLSLCAGATSAVDCRGSIELTPA